MKNNLKTGAILTIILGSSMAVADASILYNNLPSDPTQIAGNGEFAGYGIVVANEFSTGTTSCPGGCLLGNITLNLTSPYTPDPSGTLLQIFTDASGTPSTTLVGTYSDPTAFTTNFGNNVFKPIGQITLNTNTNYWVELSSTSNNGVTWDTGNTAAPNQPNLGGFIYAGSLTPSYLPLLMSVSATSINTASAVPLPGAVWMMGAALLGLVTTWRKKSYL